MSLFITLSEGPRARSIGGMNMEGSAEEAEETCPGDSIAADVARSTPPFTMLTHRSMPLVTQETAR